MILGQESLCTSINEYSLDTFPKSLMLVGPKGSGKDLLIDYIAQHLNLPIQHLNDMSVEILDNIYLSIDPIIYVFDNLSVKMQNQVLKFIEEPPKNSFIIIKAISLDQYLATIKNRCRIWLLNKYSDSILKEFCDAENSQLVLNVAETPGEVIALNTCNLYAAYNLCDKIIDKISVASYGNLFNILDTVKNDIKIDIELFVKVLRYTIKNKIHVYPSIHQWYGIYVLTNTLYKELMINHVNKDQLFENYLITLKEYYANNRS